MNAPTPARCGPSPFQATRAPFSPPPLKFEVRRWLVEVVLDWGCFNVVSAATYLGFSVGPEGGSRSWKGPMAKWTGRASRIGASGAPAGVAAQLHSATAVLVFGYVAQAHGPLGVWRTLSGGPLGVFWACQATRWGDVGKSNSPTLEAVDSVASRTSWLVAFGPRSRSSPIGQRMSPGWVPRSAPARRP